MSQQKRLSFWQIWNMSFGFFGIQMGWGLQMGNMSAIYEYLGAAPDDIPLLWLAAPLTGLIVQPIIGYMSDRTWTSLGRRRPYFLIGAILASIALIFMPNSPSVWMAAGMLWILDASINVSMEPFRAFVADKLPEEQRTKGFAMQSLFIGIGAVLASALPWFMLNVMDMSAESASGEIPAYVRISFYVGAAVFIGAVCWTVFTTSEEPPEDMEAFEKAKAESAGFMSGLSEIMEAALNMPKTMRQLAWVQICTWLGLFCMWIYFTVSITRSVFDYQDMPDEYGYVADVLNGGTLAAVMKNNPEDHFTPEQLELMSEKYGSFIGFIEHAKVEFGSVKNFRAHVSGERKKYSEGVAWGNLCFGFYSLVTFIFALFLPVLADATSRKTAHFLCLTAGGLGLISTYFVSDPYLLLLSMAGVGIAWASILSMPYAMLAGSLPKEKYGVYMGIFNFFIVLPQIIASLGFGFVMSQLLNNNTLVAVAIGGGFMLLAGIFTLFVDDSAADQIGISEDTALQ